MNKDEIIELLKEQSSHYKSLADSLLVQVKELTEKIARIPYCCKKCVSYNRIFSGNSGNSF